MRDLLQDLKRAIETGDAELWSSLHSDDFEQTELWHKTDPPSNPTKRGKADVAEIVGRAVKNGVQFRVENMVGDSTRIAYTVTCVQPNGRTVISNNNAEVRDGLIVGELVVEAGEPS
jgi:ketosteroid isomerase-like protein